MNKQKALEDVVQTIDEAIASLEHKNPELFGSKMFLSIVLNGLAHALIKYSEVANLDCKTITKYIQDLWAQTFDFH